MPNLKDSNGRELVTYNIIGDDFKELEGKIVNYKIDEDRIIPALVVGCNRSIGCTLVNPTNKDEYYACIIGPVAPGYNHASWGDSYDEMFDALVTDLRNGTVDVLNTLIKYYKLNAHFGKDPDGSTCAYGQ